MTARSQPNLERVQKEILQEVPGATILIHKVDVTVPEQVEAAVEAAIAKFGKLDVVIANAGTSNAWNTRKLYPLSRRLVKTDICCSLRKDKAK